MGIKLEDGASITIDGQKIDPDMYWRDVEKELPVIDYENYKSNIKVLIYSDKKVLQAFYREIFKQGLDEKGSPIVIKEKRIFHTFCKSCLEGEEIKPTHWMLLPKPPKA